MELVLERARTGSRPGHRTDGCRLGLVVEGGGMRGCVSAGSLMALYQLGLKCVGSAYCPCRRLVTLHLASETCQQHAAQVFDVRVQCRIDIGVMGATCAFGRCFGFSARESCSPASSLSCLLLCVHRRRASQ